MNFWEKFKIAWATFRRLGGIELPDAGRSSEETLSGAMSAYLSSFGPVTPVIDWEMLRTLKCFWLYNPDFTQYIANVVNLGNPGHHITIEARSDSTIAAAIDRVNESASRIYKLGVGVDGLLNQYLTSLTWSGAISSEDVVNFAARRVEKVVFVPVEQIRFRYNKDLDAYEPYQRARTFIRPAKDSWMGMFKLNSGDLQIFCTVDHRKFAVCQTAGDGSCRSDPRRPEADHGKHSVHGTEDRADGIDLCIGGPAAQKARRDRIGVSGPRDGLYQSDKDRSRRQFQQRSRRHLSRSKDRSHSA
jgi:hypothetical protein